MVVSTIHTLSQTPRIDQLDHICLRDIPVTVAAHTITAAKVATTIIILHLPLITAMSVATVTAPIETKADTHLRFLCKRRQVQAGSEKRFEVYGEGDKNMSS